ncbi:hypothetical protein AMECASPLE_011535 [Ameca splendens]|uniref:Uncharacterized protein n=1 Tax=Ameca splendens TaxID=208324 RepID=A0ABV0Y140_9TELE
MFEQPSPLSGACKYIEVLSHGARCSTVDEQCFIYVCEEAGGRGGELKSEVMLFILFFFLCCCLLPISSDGQEPPASEAASDHSEETDSSGEGSSQSSENKCED